MKSLKVFNDIQYEVEHPLFLARIVRMPSGRKAKVMVNEFEAVSKPVDAVLVRYIPKFDRVTYDGRPFDGMEGAYRVLYEVMVWVGESHDERDIMEITRRAQALAESNPDPVSWKEDEGITFN